MRPTTQQRQLLEAIAPPGARVSCRASHGIGKTTSTSALLWWFLECHEFSRVICTAPTSDQLEKGLWPEAGKWLRKSDGEMQAQQVPRRFWLSSLFNVTATQILEKTHGKEWMAFCRTVQKGRPEGIQGQHASDIEISEDGKAIARIGDSTSIMVVIDEASGVEDEVYEALEGALSSPGAREVLIGNPTRRTGFFAASHGSNRASYTPLHFAGKDSPLVDPAYRAGLVRKYGEGSNVVRVRADGEFPKQDDDVLMPFEAVEASLSRELPEGLDDRRGGILSIDIARFGSDRTVFIYRKRNAVFHIEVHAKEDTMQTAGRAVDLAHRLGASEIKVDENGVGGGVVDRLKELHREGRLKAEVIGVMVSESAPDRVDGEDAQGRTMRDYLWLQAKAWFAEDEPSLIAAPKDYAEMLCAELVSVKYGFDSSGRIVVESKDEMKRRLKGTSPDIADALCASFAPPAPVHTTVVSTLVV